MHYFVRDIKTKFEYRKGTWTCDANSVGIKLSEGDNPYPEIMRLMVWISARTQLYPFTILYKCNRFGFNRVDQYKGLKSQESDLFLSNCLRFSEEDDKGCSYMYSCAQIDPNVTNPCIFNFHQSVVFLANKSNYQYVINIIPKLISIENIENYLIQSGMIVIESEDTFDMGYYLWLITNKEKIQSLIDIIQQYT